MVRLAIAGMGYIGQVHYAASRQVSDARVVAVCTSRPDVARQSCGSDVGLYRSYHDMLVEAQPDAVLVCVPTFLHDSYVIEALARSCAVLCEKPLALSAGRAGKMVAAAERAGVVLMVAQVLRFSPQYVVIRRKVEQGQLGSVVALHAHRLASYPAWNKWLRDPANGGGCLLDLQVHDVDYVYWLLGRPSEVYTAGIKSNRGSWDHVSTSLRYGNCVATIESSFLMPDSWPFNCSLRVTGTQGALEYLFRVTGNIWERDQAVNELVLYPAGASASHVSVQDEDMYVEQLRHFVECVKDGRSSDICPLQHSLEVMRLMDASLQSAESGRPILSAQCDR